jgi:hypothetical protein
MPRGFLTEAGPRPEFAEHYGAREVPSAEYPERTRANVRDSDATLWFGTTDSRGARTTFGACERLGKSCVRVYPGALTRPLHIAEWIREHKIKVLNVAGNRASGNPGIGARVERSLAAVLRRLGHRPV